MRLLVVHAHPAPDSFSAALCQAVLAGAAQGGHDCRLIDLYAQGFDPVMQRDEWRAYETGQTRLGDDAHLAWAEGVVLVYPTWWQGPPAMLKGWIERHWRPGLAFAVEGGQMRPLLPLKLLAVVTTFGAPNWFAAQAMALVGRQVVLGGLGSAAKGRPRKLWLSLHDAQAPAPDRRARFLAQVRQRFAGLG